ncbi:MAG: hypothetical protein ACTHMC_28415 [Pseudobacter sp.]|uniref:hypothetical protein n=1 Tax=Pseudobacter sp. TaxID=2045420 RepID=UPI003F81A092
MRSLLLAGCICLCGLLFSRCTKEKDTANDNPLTARSEHNSSNYGVYKGIFVGSTGVIVVNLRNDAEFVIATIRIDGRLHHFTTTGILQKGMFTTLQFKSGASSFLFTVGADGEGVAISDLIVEGHPDARVILLKEKSDALISCYEGKYKGSSEGTWNVIVRKNQLLGLVKSGSQSAVVTGIVAADKSTSGEVSSGAVFEGLFIKDQVSGTWTNDTGDIPESGTWEGVKTY